LFSGYQHSLVVLFAYQHSLFLVHNITYADPVAVSMALGKSGPPSRRESKDALEYRDDRNVAERCKKHSNARQDDHEENRRRETGRPDWGSMGTRPSMPNPTKVCRKEILSMVVHLLVLRVPLGILCPVPYGRPANPYVLAMTWEEEYLSPCRQALQESRAMLVALHRLWRNPRRGGPSGLTTPIFSFSLSSLEPKSLRMVILTIILVQV